ncbi:MAG TPA: LON peptidase substrate-binding domain-containing protein [Burkholderiales bacterium]|nr:LON peptidase substrate-binding domain-containing protein [Burkholderiales bacterium]
MKIPVFPLHAVLFPGSLLPLKIFEQRYVDMLKACLRDSQPFGVFLIRKGAEVGAPAVPYRVGCLAHILDWEMPQLGVFHVKALGAQKVRISGTKTQPNGLLTAAAETLEPDADTPLAPEYAICARVLHMIIEKIGEERFHSPLRFDDAVWVSYRLAEVLPIGLHVRQQILELNESAARFEVLLYFLKQQGLET